MLERISRKEDFRSLPPECVTVAVDQLSLAFDSMLFH